MPGPASFRYSVTVGNQAERLHSTAKPTKGHPEVKRELHDSGSSLGDRVFQNGIVAFADQ